jgi:nucleoside-diphosphate-sugar epimerase
VDVLDRDAVERVMLRFAPDEIVHLAAKTDFVSWNDPEGFRINTEGTRNVFAAANRLGGRTRCLLASSHVVTKQARLANGRQYYCDSKLAAEAVVRAMPDLRIVWAILRPCSLWGPWLATPFHDFFLAIARGRYVHLGTMNPQKRLGYIGNACHQIAALLDAAPAAIQGRTFHLADYETITIREWADRIAEALGTPRPKTVPELCVRAAAAIGDGLSWCGYRNPPLTSLRLRNMRTDTSDISIDEIARIAATLPFTVDDGIRETVRWFRQTGKLS